MAFVKLKNVNKIYPNNSHAVIDFNLEIKDKEFIVFVGPSGCGKSTTLRMIAGLEEITTGEFYIDDKLMNYTHPKDRDIAMVFQSYALYPHMSVYNNIAYGLKIRKTFLPVYEESEEIDIIVNKNKSLHKELKKLEKDIEKNTDNKIFLNRRDEIIKEILDNLNKINSLRKIKIGIPTQRIDYLKKTISALQKDISSLKEQKAKEESLETIDETYLQLVIDDLKYEESELKEKKNELDSILGKEVELYIERKMNKVEIDYEVMHAAEILGLTPYLSRFPAQLSGGQRQRVALGRAIVRHPKLFLMDEPLSNLDAKLRVQTRNEISNIHKKVGATTIYVTHDQIEAMTLADRIVVMKDGVVQQISTPMEAFHDPNNIFVAGFIGSPAMNFIDATVRDNKVIINDDISITISDSDKKLLKDYQDKPIVLGVRAENVHFASDNIDKEVTPSFKLKFENIELLGNEFIYYSSINEHPFIMKSNIRVPFKADDEFELVLEKDTLYFFNKETTERIR